MAGARLCLVLVFLFAAVGCSKRETTPKATFEKMGALATAGDWDSFFAGLTKRSQSQFMTMAPDGFSKLMERAAKPEILARSFGAIVAESTDGDAAKLTVRDAEGNERTVVMLMEAGGWKYDMFYSHTEQMAKREGLDVAEYRQLVDVRAGLRRIRKCIEEHEMNGEAVPDFMTDDWASSCGFSRVPENPLSPQGVGARLIEVSEAGVTGGDIDPADCGWVWNRADQAFYAAGVDD